MGDKLATGWADSKALEAAQQSHVNELRYQQDVKAFLDANQRRQMREYLAEEAAEEDMLP